MVHRNSLTASHDLSFAAFRRKSSCEELGVRSQRNELWLHVMCSIYRSFCSHIIDTEHIYS